MSERTPSPNTGVPPDADRPATPSPSASARPSDPSGPKANEAARDLAWLAPVVLGGFLLLGVVSALEMIAVLASDGGSLTSSQRFATRLGAVFHLFFYGLIGWFLSRLVRAAAALFDLLARRSEAAESAERGVILALARVAEALERPAAPPAPSPSSAPVPVPVLAKGTDAHLLAEARRAIQRSEWAEAAGLIQRHAEEHPDDPEGTRLARELDTARAEAAQDLRARVDAARQVNDYVRVLELRDSLVLLLDAEALRSFDQETVRWLMALIQKRIRAGTGRSTVRTEVADLASMVAERFDHTAEGASLRAALPTLRRSAGLCARCGQPYTGIADACPACLATSSFPAFGAPQPPETSDGSAPEPEPDSEPDPYFERDEDEVEEP